MWEGEGDAPPPCPRPSGGGDAHLVPSAVLADAHLVPSAVLADVLGLPQGAPQRWTDVERGLDAYVAARGLLLRPSRPRPSPLDVSPRDVSPLDVPGAVVVLDAGLRRALRLGPPLPHRSTMAGPDLKRYLRSLEPPTCSVPQFL